MVHLAAQAGVRYSLEHPHAYIHSNVTGTLNVLEGCRHNGVEHLVYASTSSVYGANTNMPFSVHNIADHPLSLYAATKRANELMAHNYSALFKLPTTGPALLHRLRSLGPPGHGAVHVHAQHPRGPARSTCSTTATTSATSPTWRTSPKGWCALSARVAQPDPAWRSDAPDPATSFAPFRIYNIGNSSPVPLMRYIEIIEECLGRKAQKNLLPLQLGDVPDTSADVEDLAADVGYRPATSVEVGVRNFVDWFCDYYGYKR